MVSVAIESDSFVLVPLLSLYISLRESNGTKTQRNCSLSLQKPHGRQVNRQRSLGKDFYGQSVRIFKLKKESFFAIQILVISLLRDDQRSHGLIAHIAWGTCAKVRGLIFRRAYYRKDFCV